MNYSRARRIVASHHSTNFCTQNDPFKLVIGILEHWLNSQSILTKIESYNGRRISAKSLHLLGYRWHVWRICSQCRVWLRSVLSLRNMARPSRVYLIVKFCNLLQWRNGLPEMIYDYDLIMWIPMSFQCHSFFLVYLFTIC